MVKASIQAQSGDQRNGLTEGLAAVEQVQHGVAVVSHDHQGAVGQPAAQLQDHLASPESVSFLWRRPCRW